MLPRRDRPGRGTRTPRPSLLVVTCISYLLMGTICVLEYTPGGGAWGSPAGVVRRESAICVLQLLRLPQSTRNHHVICTQWACTIVRGSISARFYALGLFNFRHHVPVFQGTHRIGLSNSCHDNAGHTEHTLLDQTEPMWCGNVIYLKRSSACYTQQHEPSCGRTSAQPTQPIQPMREICLFYL